MELLKYCKCIKPSKEERIQSVLPKLDGSLACLMPSSAIEAANSHSLIALYVKFLAMALLMKIVQCHLKQYVEHIKRLQTNLYSYSHRRF